jgi:hypothetical protein
VTPIEWSQVKTRVTALWGRTTKWDNATELTRDVTHIPQTAALTAVEDHIGSKHPPSPADIIHAAQAQLIGGPPVKTQPGPEDCNHPGWAIVEYLDDGRRRGICRICRLERVFGIGELLMEWEIEEKRQATQTQEAPY